MNWMKTKKVEFKGRPRNKIKQINELDEDKNLFMTMKELTERCDIEECQPQMRQGQKFEECCQKCLYADVKPTTS